MLPELAAARRGCRSPPLGLQARRMYDSITFPTDFPARRRAWPRSNIGRIETKRASV